MCTDITATGNYTCSCPEPYFGTGCQNIDECIDNPCLNDGQCMFEPTNFNQFICNCPMNTEGELCEIVISPCASSPCQNGMCQDDGDSFTCLCSAGFTGEICVVDIDDCAQNPCLNGGTCRDAVNDFICDCPSGFSGQSCETNLVFCQSESCANGATCVEEVEGFSCVCTTGFTGETCDTNIDECQLSPCMNNSTCIDIEGSFACICLPGFTGELCDTMINFCESNPCGSNGVCTPLLNDFECTCDPGFSGPQCVEINECEPNPCQNSVMCVNGINQFTCICDFGFSGPLCEVDINECESSPCENGGTCLDAVGQFTCACPPSFTGLRCEAEINFCASNPCFNGGTCSNSNGGFVCQCLTGWSGDRCQNADSVSTKLTSCGLEAMDVFGVLGSASDGGSVAFTDTTDIGGVFILGFTNGLYFSAWVWQEDETVANIVTYNSSISVTLVSDIPNNEVVFYYRSTSFAQRSIVFGSVPIIGNEWHHIALSVANNEVVSLAIDGIYFQERLAEGISSSPMAIIVIGRGDDAHPVNEPFRGIMRGVALASLPETMIDLDQPVEGDPDQPNFDLATLEVCTLNCIGGDDYCVNGQCQDLFGPECKCLCPYGYTGPFCQYLQSRLSFDGSGYAQLPNAGESFNSFELDFKTDMNSGEIYSHSGQNFQYSLSLQSGGVEIELQYCNSSVDSFSVLSPSLTNLQWHSIFIATDSLLPLLTVQLDNEQQESFGLASPECTDTGPSTLNFGGSSSAQSNLTGCIRDIAFNSIQLDSTAVELLGNADFGCVRDTAQFFGESYLELPEFISRESQTISLDFNTLDTNGVIYFSRREPTEATGTNPIDFIAIYLDNGEVIFTFNLGEDDIVFRTDFTVNDGQWHRLEASQNLTMGGLVVDGIEIAGPVSAGQLMLLDTTGSVFLGGVPPEGQTSRFSEFDSFSGCVRDLSQNLQEADLQDHMSVQNVRFGTCN